MQKSKFKGQNYRSKLQVKIQKGEKELNKM